MESMWKHDAMKASEFFSLGHCCIVMINWLYIFETYDYIWNNIVILIVPKPNGQFVGVPGYEFRSSECIRFSHSRSLFLLQRLTILFLVSIVIYMVEYVVH
jgi:hypothetical protein